MAIKEQDVVLVAKDTSGNKVIQMPITRVENVEGAIKTVNKVAPDASGNVAINTVANATKATQDGDGNVISDTYLKSATAETTYLSQANASITYLEKTAKAESAKTSDTATAANAATKATQDADGNVITTTYATKTEVTTGLNDKLGKNEKATAAASADTATKATQDGDGNVISSTYAKKSEVTTITSGTDDLTAGSSTLATGALYFVYE